jgi:hypothetical protein
MSRALTFYVGTALFGVGVLECFLNEVSGSGDIWYDPSYASFMFVGDLLLLLWMWGVSVQVWRNCGIDFMKLLSLETTTLVSMEKPEETVYGCAKELTIVYLTTFICFNMTQRGVFGGNNLQRKSFHVVHMLPPLMIAYFVYRAITPWQIKKKWFWFLFKVISAPLYPVDFQAGYVGDLLTSLVRVLISMAYSMIYYLLVPVVMFMSFDASVEESELERTQDTGGAESVVDRLTGFEYMRQSTWWSSNGVVQIVIIPALTLIPLVIRLLQCLRRSVETGQRWPHVANAAKYTSAILVVATGTLFPSVRSSLLWVLSFVGATCYQFLWDITMDWGLVVKANNPLAQDNTSFGGLALRKHRLLGPLYTYMVIMAMNLLLRFAWTLTLVQQSSFASSNDDNSGGGGDVSSDSWALLLTALFAHLTPVIAAAEVLRRMVWGFLRLEWEQIEKMSIMFSASGEGGDADADADGEQGFGGNRGENDGVWGRDKTTLDTDPLVGSSSSGSGSGSGSGMGGTDQMERMGIGRSNTFPDFYAPWDPDGRFHSILPHLAALTSCCASVDFPAMFEAVPVLMPDWFVCAVCDNRALAPLLADMTMAGQSVNGDASSGTGDKGDCEGEGEGGDVVGSEVSSRQLSDDKGKGEGCGRRYKRQRVRMAEGTLFAGLVLTYLATLVALRVVYGK